MNAITKINTDWTSIDTPVEHEGKRIVLPSDPNNMGYDAAIATLQRVKEQEEQKFDAHEIVEGAPWDSLVAIYKAMQRIYGVVMAQSQKTFFGEIKPDMVTINTGPNPTDRIQVPAGHMSLPNVSEPVDIGMFHGGAYIRGVVRRRDRALLVQIANEARDILRNESVYRGKAIRLGVDSDGDLILGKQPEFLDLSRVVEDDMIHTAETEALIRCNIFAPLKNTEACRQHRIPLKRGILLEGKYGTGKSLTARVTAKVATDHGWTFIMLDRSQGLKTAINFARAYQPCVIFAEDIDRSADRDDEDVNDLVNMLDGMISKEMEMMAVLTTNFIEKIDRALLRPGRFDAVISIQPPDAETSMRLIHAYARGLLGKDDLSEVGKVVSGWIPATIREVVERAKLSMLTENRAAITADDLKIAAIGMRRHMELLEPKAEEKTPEQAFGEAFRKLVDTALDGDLSGSTDHDIDDVYREVARTQDHARSARETIGEVHRIAKAAAHSAETGLEVGKATLAAVRAA